MDDTRLDRIVALFEGLKREDVSREHLQIRCGDDGSFELKDLSTRGTWINDHRVECSMQTNPLTDEREDTDRWEPLPPQARINLAGEVMLEFTAVKQ